MWEKRATASDRVLLLNSYPFSYYLIEDLTEMKIPSQINSPLKEDLRLQMKLLNLVKLFVEPHL